MKFSQGAFNVRTNEDCRNAIEYILKNGAKHTEKDVRIFMKAIERYCNFLKIGDNPQVKEIDEDDVIEDGETIYKAYREILGALN